MSTRLPLRLLQRLYPVLQTLFFVSMLYLYLACFMYLEPDMSYQTVVTLNEEAEAKMKEEREERKQLRAQNKQNEESAFSFLLRVSIIYMLMRFIISRNSLTRQERYRAWAQQQQQRIDDCD